MKKHSGKEIQNLASTVRIVITVIAAILAIFWLGIIASGERGSIAGGILVGAVIFGIGYFFAWLVTCILHGYGEIIENTAETASYLNMLVTHFTVEATTESAHKPKEESEVGAEPNTQEIIGESESEQTQIVSFPFDRSTVEQITCPECNKTQFSSRNRCYHCGIKFQFADDCQN